MSGSYEDLAWMAWMLRYGHWEPSIEILAHWKPRDAPNIYLTGNHVEIMMSESRRHFCWLRLCRNVLLALRLDCSDKAGRLILNFAQTKVGLPLKKFIRKPMPRKKPLLFAQKRRSRMILPRLFRCEELAVCLYSDALRASHSRQTDAMQNWGIFFLSSGLPEQGIKLR